MSLPMEIKTLILELSSRCQAKCPFCSRLQKTRPYGGHDITPQDFRLLPQDMLAGLRQVSMGGNFGDLCANAGTLDIVRYIRELNPEALICGDSNGSLQDEDWWRELGAVTGEKGFMVFALDGLADTHTIHRKNTDYAKTLANARAFAEGGGMAVWKFIVFEHNEHQIDEALETARQNGFARFYAIPSRFYNDEMHPPGGVDVTLRNDLLEESRREAQAQGVTAQCKPFHRGSVYVGADGTVMPCCFAHVHYYTGYRPEFDFMTRLMNKHESRINFKTTDFWDIVTGPFFREAFTLSRHNPFCLTKCNGQALQIKKDVVVREETFNPAFVG